MNICSLGSAQPSIKDKTSKMRFSWFMLQLSSARNHVCLNIKLWNLIPSTLVNTSRQATQVAWEYEFIMKCTLVQSISNLIASNLREAQCGNCNQKIIRFSFKHEVLLNREKFLISSPQLFSTSKAYSRAQDVAVWKCYRFSFSPTCTILAWEK